MSGLLETLIGARLEVTGAAAAIEELQGFTDAVREANTAMRAAAKSGNLLSASQVKVGDSSAAAAEKTQASADATKELAGATADANLANKATIATLAATTRAHAGLGNAISDVAKKQKSLGDQIVEAGGGAFGKLGKYGIAAGVGLAYEGIKSYSAFQAAQTKLVTLAGVKKKNLPGLTSEEVANAQKYAITLNDMASGTYRLASATVGLKGGNKLLHEMIPAFAQAATLLQTTPGAGTTQLARVFGAMRNAGYKNQLQGVGSSSHIAAMLAAAAGAGDTTGTDIVTALGSGILQQGAALHMKASDLLAYIDLSTRYASNPKTAGTLVAHTLAMISNPSAAGQQALQAFGVNWGQLRQTSSTKGVPAAVESVAAAIKAGLHPSASMPSVSYAPNGKTIHGIPGTMENAGLLLEKWGVSTGVVNQLISGKQLSKQDETSLFNTVVGKAFGGGKQEATFLTAAINPKLMGEISKYITGNATKAQLNAKLNETMDTPAFKQRQAFNDLKIDLMKVGQAIMPAWLSLLNVMEKVTNWFSKNADAAKALFIALGTVVGAGAALWLGGKAIQLYRGLSTAAGGVSKILGWAPGATTTAATDTSLGAAGKSLLTAGEELQLAADRLSGASIAEGEGGLVNGVERNGGAVPVGRPRSEPPVAVPPGAGTDAERVMTKIPFLQTVAGIALSAMQTARMWTGQKVMDPLGHLGRHFDPALVEPVLSHWLASNHMWNSKQGIWGNLGNEATGVGHTAESWFDGIFGRHPKKPPPPTPMEKFNNKFKGINGMVSSFYNETMNSTAWDAQHHANPVLNTKSFQNVIANLTKGGVNINAQQAIGKDSSAASKDLTTAAKETQKAATLDQKASTQSLGASAATKLQASALQTAAKEHQTAAKALSAAAAAIIAATAKFNSGQITASQLAGLVNKANATSQAHGK